MALGVDHRALLVHDLVVLEDVLAGLEVLLLDLGLRAADGPGDHLGLDRHVLRQVEPGHDRLDHGAVEPPHELVAEGQVEARLPGVALTSRAAAELVVDAPRLVALGAEDVEPAGLLDVDGLAGHLVLDLGEGLVPRRLVLLAGVDGVEPLRAQALVGDEVGVAAEHDVGTAAGHVRRDGDRAAPPGLGDDLRLLLVELGVEHRVLHAPRGQQLRQVLRALDAGGADQHRLAALEVLGDVVGHGLELGGLGLVDEVRLVDAPGRLVGRDRDHAELVGLRELRRLGLGGTGHPARASRTGGSSSAA